MTLRRRQHREVRRRFGTGRRVVALFAPYRRRIYLWIGVVLAASALGVAAPLLTKPVFDSALFPESGQPDLGLLVLLVGLMVASIVLGGVLAIVQTYLANVIGQRVMHDLRHRLYTHLQQMSLGFFTATRTGEIQSRVANDVGGVGLVVTDTISVVVSNSIFVVSSIVAMAYLSWQLTLFSLLVVPAFVLLGRRVGRARRRLSTETQETLAEMSVITQETLSVSGALLTKMFDWRGETANRYGRESERLAALKVRQEMIGRTFLGLSQTFFLAAPALLYLTAGLLLADTTGTHITAGALVAFTALQARLYFPMRDMMNISLELHVAGALFDRIFEYLDLPHEVGDRPNARIVPREGARGRVTLRNVCFRYDRSQEGDPAADGATQRWTLEDINLSIEPGQLAALVGPSGAGKTTISYLVPRLYDVASGTVEIDGLDVRDIKLASLAELIGMVTQETYLLHATVRENLLFAQPDAAEGDIVDAARAAHIHERILEFPDGYETIVGERGYRLSGGEKQRLAIARVILKDPRILILDEATSALDTISERLVQDALRKLVAGRTTIAIAHRLSTIMAADVVFVLERGRLVEQGTHEELLERGGLYARLYEQQFRGDPLASGDEQAVPLGETADSVR
jgi:ATP-binding cassette subfamily B protein